MRVSSMHLSWAALLIIYLPSTRLTLEFTNCLQPHTPPHVYASLCSSSQIVLSIVKITHRAGWNGDAIIRLLRPRIQVVHVYAGIAFIPVSGEKLLQKGRIGRPGHLEREELCILLQEEPRVALPGIQREVPQRKLARPLPHLLHLLVHVPGHVHPLGNVFRAILPDWDEVVVRLQPPE